LVVKLPEEAIPRLLDKLRGMGYDVVAPHKANGSVKLERIAAGESPELNYVRLSNSPGEFLLPCKESLFRYKSLAIVTSYGLKIRFPTVEGPCPVALTPEFSLPKGNLAFFGIHPCMVNSIRYLDRVMQGEPADPYYRGRREAMLVVTLECEEGDEYCLCRTLGTHQIPAGYSDISLRRADNGFLAMADSRIGGEILSSLALPEEDLDQTRPIPRMKRSYVIDRADETWINETDASPYTDTCTLCCACTVGCPTCYCSDIEDEFSLMDPANVERVRTRMSCQRKAYSTIAGGTTFLKTKEARFRWRLKHKFPYSNRNYDMPGCVGCGNCIALCPSRIDFREFLGRRVA
jgi:ferredoxin